jgi:hypothetical protein
VVYERDHPIPVLRDTWGGAMVTNEQRLKRAELIAGLMFETEFSRDNMDRLLAHLYPGGAGEDIIARFDVQCAWREMPTRFRSWMVRVVVMNRVATVAQLSELARNLGSPYKAEWTGGSRAWAVQAWPTSVPRRCGERLPYSASNHCLRLSEGCRCQ